MSLDSMPPTSSVSQTSNTSPSNTVTNRQHGSLVDVITLVSYPFQFEPDVQRDRCSVYFGEKPVVGQRLQGYHWVGGGKDDVELDIYLVGAAYTNINTPTPSSVLATMVAAKGSYQYWLQVPTGGTNPDGSTQMTMVKNLNPPPMNADQATTKLQAQASYPTSSSSSPPLSFAIGRA